MLRRKVLPLLLAVLIAIATICWSSSAKTEAQKEIKIGVALSSSGVFARQGALMKNGYELWANYANNRGGINVSGQKYLVRMIYLDDQSDAPTAAKLVEKLITKDNVDFLFGPFGSGMTMASSSISEKYKKLMIAPVSNADPLYTRGYRYLFGVLGPGKYTMITHLELLAHQNPRPVTVAIVSPDDLFSLTVAESARMGIEEYKFTKAYDEKFSKDKTDFSDIVANLRRVNADVILSTTQTEQAMSLMKAIAQYRLDFKYFGVINGPEVPGWSRDLGKIGDYAATVSLWSPEANFECPVFGSSKKYTQLYMQTYNERPEQFAAGASGAGVILQLAIEKAGTTDVERVRDEVSKTSRVIFFGDIVYSKGGMSIGNKGLVTQIQNQKPVVVWPQNVAQAKPLYPAPPWNRR